MLEVEEVEAEQSRFTKEFMAAHLLSSISNGMSVIGDGQPFVDTSLWFYVCVLISDVILSNQWVLEFDIILVDAADWRAIRGSLSEVHQPHPQKLRTHP